jgi:hypothetical protein
VTLRPPTRTSKKTAASSSRETDPDDRHRSRCRTCKSADLAEIERGYLSWEPVRRLAAVFEVDEKSIRRHVAWFGLDLTRNANWERALGRIVEAGVEKALEGEATLDHAIRAAKLLAHLSPASPQAAAGREPTWEESIRLAEVYRRGGVPELHDGG